jgi:hypothetical protein
VRAVGQPRTHLDSMLSPHQQLARSIGADPNTVLGGIVRRQSDGTFDFDENSGHYGERWTPALTNQFSEFLSQYGMPHVTTPWGG